jgi:hypothetical protein
MNRTDTGGPAFPHEALRIADELDTTPATQRVVWFAAAGKELRRLHTVNQELLKALDTISGLSQAMLAQSMFEKRAQDAIAKAERTTP